MAARLITLSDLCGTGGFELLLLGNSWFFIFSRKMMPLLQLHKLYVCSICRNKTNYVLKVAAVGSVL